MSKLEQYIDDQNKIIAKNREKTLIALGLTEKEYSPDGAKTREHKEYDYSNGEKRYYRNVAIQVTDEEYELILSKKKQVDKILATNKTSNKPFYLLPIKRDSDEFKSTIAVVLRAVAWVFGLIMAFAGIIIAVNTESFTPVLLGVGLGAFELLMFYSLAAILDYLAELAFIARNGYKYTDTQ